MSQPGQEPEERRVTPKDQAATPGKPEARAGAEPSPVARPEPQSPAQDALAAGPFPGAEILTAGSPREIMRRILAGDPLGVVDRARHWLDANAFLLDSNRLALRTMAHIAHSARYYSGRPDLHTWIELLLERATKSLIDEDREADRLETPVEEDEIAPFAFLSDALGIEPSLARRACVVFNGMPEYDRRVFYATSVLGKSLQRHVSEGNGPPAKAEAALQRVLRSLRSIDGMPGSGP